MTGGSRKDISKRSKAGQFGNSKRRAIHTDDQDLAFPIEIFTKGETRVQESGIIKSLTIEHATQIRIYQQAVDGDRKATAEVLRWIAG